MSDSYKNSIARIIRNRDNAPIGAGVLVGSNFVLTCAHVVNSALGLSQFSQEPPPEDSIVRFDFPLPAPTVIFSATVEKWLAPAGNGGGDLALLKMEISPPETAAFARFVDQKEVWGHSFRSFGFPKYHPEGRDASGILRGRNAIQRLMMEQVYGAQNFALPGFSGTGVWDDQLEAMIGITVLGDFDGPQISAFLIPTDEIRKFWPEFQTPEKKVARYSYEPELVKVPAGVFQMGNSGDPSPWELHEVQLSSYSISKHPVTNAQYAEFVKSNPDKRPERGWHGTQPPPMSLDSPVVWISWHKAKAYCQWLSNLTHHFYRLPNEAEWEKAVKSSLIDIKLIREWTSTLWGNHWKTAQFTYPYRNDLREDLEATGYRIYRGMKSSLERLSRSFLSPDTVDNDLSFRVVMVDSE